VKVVLFCGGLGTRIREYPEPVPKPMIPIGHEPILWHLMKYYSHYGHRDFVLCMGYKADVIKRFFLDYRPQMYADCVVSGHGARVEMLEGPQDDWRVALIDTGIWRNIGQRLWAVRNQVNKEEMFLANYSDGLADVDLNEMISRFRASGKVACFLAVHPPVTFHMADIDASGRVQALRGSDESDIWINGGFFIMRPEIFDYMEDGEELVVEPFLRLIADDKLLAYKHVGFWRAMDTLRDRQVLEAMIERGQTPWRVAGPTAGVQTMEMTS
jgi:glucose-1-phosphate cytidylyltransferase